MINWSLNRESNELKFHMTYAHYKEVGSLSLCFVTASIHGKLLYALPQAPSIVLSSFY